MPGRVGRPPLGSSWVPFPVPSVPLYRIGAFRAAGPPLSSLQDKDRRACRTNADNNIRQTLTTESDEIHLRGAPPDSA